MCSEAFPRFTPRYERVGGDEDIERTGRQKDAEVSVGRSSSRSHAHQKSRSRTRRATESRKDPRDDVQLEFAVEDMYCIGSPIGLFQMLEGSTIAGRHNLALASYESAVNTMSNVEMDYDPASFDSSPDISANTSPKIGQYSVLLI